MFVNLNVRELSNGAVYAQYTKRGKTEEVAFPNWDGFLAWVKTEVDANRPPAAIAATAAAGQSQGET